MLIIKKHGRDHCLWCASDKEGVHVEMQDGSLKGFLCKNDFWTLIKKRSDNGKPQPANAAASQK